jgi:hypothetical protein
MRVAAAHEAWLALAQRVAAACSERRLSRLLAAAQQHQIPSLRGTQLPELIQGFSVLQQRMQDVRDSVVTPLLQAGQQVLQLAQELEAFDAACGQAQGDDQRQQRVGAAAAAAGGAGGGGGASSGCGGEGDGQQPAAASFEEREDGGDEAADDDDDDDDDDMLDVLDLLSEVRAAAGPVWSCCDSTAFSGYPPHRRATALIPWLLFTDARPPCLRSLLGSSAGRPRL